MGLQQTYHWKMGDFGFDSIDVAMYYVTRLLSLDSSDYIVCYLKGSLVLGFD